MIANRSPCPCCKSRGGEVLLEVSGVQEIECFNCGTIWIRVSHDVIHTDPLTQYILTGECE